MILFGLFLVVGCTNKPDSDRRNQKTIDVIVESPIMLSMAILTGAGGYYKQYVHVRILNSDNSAEAQQGHVILRSGWSNERIAWLEDDSLWHPLGTVLRLTLKNEDRYPDIRIQDCLRIEVLQDGHVETKRFVRANSQNKGPAGIIESYAGPKKSKTEIQQLTYDAKNGSGKAAFSLAEYYDTVGNDEKKANQYYVLAEELHYPPAFFRIALLEWKSNPAPDLDRIEKYAAKAAQAGVKYADELLAEIVEAKSSGVIPNKTKLRFVLPKEAEKTKDPRKDVSVRRGAL